MNRKRVVMGAASASVLLVAVLAGCEEMATDDRQTQGGLKPDNVADTSDVTIWRNADDVPNIAIFCADGLGFASTLSVDGARQPQLLRLPERDQRCGR